MSDDSPNSAADQATQQTPSGRTLLASSAEYDPIVVDSEMTGQRVHELLNRTRESAKLDFKRTINIQVTADKVELAKDVIAMANSAGGYIVIGVDDNGIKEGLTEQEVAPLDESTIRRQIEGFVGTSLELFVDRCEWQAKKFCIITVLRSPRSPLVFEHDGQHEKPGAKKSTRVFSAGDVFVRHGSSSERWTQADVQAIYSRVVEREREQWLRDVLPDVRRLISMASGGVEAPKADARALMTGDSESLERALRDITRRLR